MLQPMDAATAYIVKRVLQIRWGDKPCAHSTIEPIGVPSGTETGQWFCQDCGMDILPTEDQRERALNPKPAPDESRADRVPD